MMVYDLKVRDCVAFVVATFLVAAILFVVYFLLLFSFWLDCWRLLCRHERIIDVEVNRIAVAKTFRSACHPLHGNTDESTTTSVLGVYVLSNGMMSAV